MARFFQIFAIGFAAVAFASEAPVDSPESPTPWQTELQDVEVQISNLKKKKSANVEQMKVSRKKGEHLLKKDYTHARLWLQKARSYERAVEILTDQIADLETSREKVLRRGQ
jgi:hypothetical protein